VIIADLYPPPARPFIARARERGGLVSTLADLLFAFCPLPKIGVTGSAGKSTTTALLAEMLRVSGQKVYTSQANEGENLWPNHELLDQLDQVSTPGWLLVELTSAHLEYMRSSPDIALITMLSPDHVEWHGSLEAYFEAKGTILQYQTGQQWAILNYDDSTRPIFAPVCRGQIIYFSLNCELEQGVFLQGDHLVARWNGETRTLAALTDVWLRQRYLGNVLAASAGALAAGVEPGAVRQAIRQFNGLPHRMELVSRVNGISIFNDAWAITPKKAGAALESFPERSLILIAGGASQTHWSDALHSSAEEEALVASACHLAARKAKAIVLFGETAPVLRDHLLAGGYRAAAIFATDSLIGALPAALRVAAAGDIILLAPIYFISEAEAEKFTAQARELAATGAV
jgi:UDP-N-acetylmuramoylalanine--D-glutamate ligase